MKPLLVALLLTVLVGHACGADISGRYSPFPSAAWNDGKPDGAMLVCDLGRLLSDDEAPRTDARGPLAVVHLIQDKARLNVRMYDATGQEVLNHKLPAIEESYVGQSVLRVSTSGRLGEGVEGGRKSFVVAIVRLFREGDRLHVHCEATQTFPRWLWFKEKKFLHRTAFVFQRIE